MDMRVLFELDDQCKFIKNKTLAIKNMFLAEQTEFPLPTKPLNH